jgi:hypothetical protein
MDYIRKVHVVGSRKFRIWKSRKQECGLINAMWIIIDYSPLTAYTIMRSYQHNGIQMIAVSIFGALVARPTGF